MRSAPRLSRVALVLAVTSCGSDKPSKAEPQDGTRAAVITASGACAVETYRAFEQAAVELRDATRALESDEAQRARARAAWVTANATWQEAELMQFGPAAAPPSPGGAYLRDQIYSWPTASRCLIEQQLVSKTYEGTGLATALVETKGLFALEYLLFHEGADNACAATAAINSSGAWGALGADEIARRKRAYARAAGDELAERARALVQAWVPEGGNFANQLARAGTGSDVFKSTHVALSAIASGLLYVDRTMKDRKLGLPLGKDMACTTPPCVDQLEARFADRSRETLQRNLVGLRKIALGCAGVEAPAFDDLLTSVGRPEMADTLRTRIAAAEAAAAAIAEPTLAPALGSDPARVDAVHAALKAISDFLKADMQTVFNFDRFSAAMMGEDRD